MVPPRLSGGRVGWRTVFGEIYAVVGRAAPAAGSTPRGRRRARGAALSSRMLIAVAAGGALGSVARYLLGALLAPRAPGFPGVTLAINVSGSLLLGALAVALAGPAHSPAVRAGLTVGLCGGYTTFSTFSLETLALLEQGSYARAGAYAAASVVLSVAAALAGAALARLLR